MDMLCISGLEKRFGVKPVLKGLELSVPEHSIFGLIGRNGAGKTTAMKAILGLLRPDAGTITVNGVRAAFGKNPVSRFTGYLPDVPEFYNFMTAEEYLRFCGGIGGMTKAKAAVRAAELLEQVGLAAEKHRISGFSRGMKQRLGVAQALFGRPKLLICDEPTSALDPVGRREILGCIVEASAETTVLFSTHILSDVEKICTDAAFLEDGRIILQGKPSALRAAYRTDSYLIETEKPEDAEALGTAFAALERTGGRQLRLKAAELPPELLRWMAGRRTAVVRIERQEPTLEDLFAGMAEKS